MTDNQVIPDTISSRMFMDAVEAKCVTIYVNSFTEQSARDFFTNFNNAIRSGQSLVPIYIDSYGGSADALASMMDIIETSPIPIATIVIGKAMSAGAILLSCGTNGLRFAAPTSRVMIHNLSSASWGKVPDLEVDVNEAKRLEKMIFGKMAKNCKKPNNYFINLLKKKSNCDWYLTPEECKKHNIINHIKLPHFLTQVCIQNILV